MFTYSANTAEHLLCIRRHTPHLGCACSHTGKDLTHSGAYILAEGTELWELWKQGSCQGAGGHRLGASRGGGRPRPDSGNIFKGVAFLSDWM